MRKITLFILFAMALIGSVLAQNKVVSGVVYSAQDNSPVIGAAVVAVGVPNMIGGATDINGEFKFSVPQNVTNVKVSCLGFKDLIVPLKSGKMKIFLKSDAEQLEEIVVVGYGTGNKIANTTASVAKVSTKDVADKPIPNMMDAVQGKVAGLQVYTSSGEPGEISNVRLHGSGSLGAGSAPLFILDGAPVSSGLIMSMNPADFESVQVLKDAAATSIYGARAANGVIYITSKKGKAQERAIITVSSQYGISNLANPDYYDTLMNSREFFDMAQEMGIMSEAVRKEKEKQFPFDTKWYQYLFRKNVPTYNADISIRGGAGKVGYYISASMLDQKGIKYRSGYSRYTLRANVNSDLNKYISMSMKNSVTYDKTITSLGTGTNYYSTGLLPFAPPYYSPYDKDGKEYEYQIPGLGYYTQKHYEDGINEPSMSLAFNSVGDITVKPIKDLTILSRVGLTVQDNTGFFYRKPSFNTSNNGEVSRNFSRSVDFMNTNTIEYKFNVLDVNHFKVLAGHEYTEQNSDWFKASGEGLTDDRLMLLGATTKDKKVDGNMSAYAFLSFFGRVSYDYDNKYYLDLTARRDGSSRFGANNRYGNFWSVGGMWKISRENFMKDISWLNDATLRFSTGTSGNAAIGNYESWALIGNYGQYHNSIGWGISTPGNPNLTWETQLKTTVGMSCRLFDMLDVDFEYYRRITYDMLMSVPYPYTSGFSEVKSNVGEYQNQGFDIKVNCDIWKNKKGDYVSFYGNLNYNRDRVNSLFQGRDSWIIPNTSVAYKVGKPVMFYMPIFKGINYDTGYAEWYLPGDDSSVTTKDKVTTAFAYELEQNTGVTRYAPFNGGLGLSASFKGIYLQADFTFVLGKHMISNDLFFSQNPRIFNGRLNAQKNVVNYWKQKGDKAEFPSLSSGQNFMDFDTRMLQDASFGRLKNLTIGYNLPKNILSYQDFVKAAKIYMSCRNLLTFTKYKGPDPEIDTNLTYSAYPNTKQISVGIQCQF